MHDPSLSPAPRAHGAEMAEALAHLEKVVVEGLKHGFFEYQVACEIIKGGKRELVIRAGKSHKFIIPAKEVPH